MSARISAGIAFFAFTMGVGILLAGHSWNGVVYVTDGSLSSPNSRFPAAIRRELDFSKLDGAELISATQKRLVTAAKMILQNGSVGIELGHFVTRDETGQRRLACDAFYNRLTLLFAGNGIASDGEKPHMEIDGPCAPSADDISSIEPIWIPVQKILKTRANDHEMAGDGDVHFRFMNMQGDWPPSWSLESVRLYNTELNDRTVAISARELHELRAHPFVVNWLEAKRAAASSVAPDIKKPETLR